MASRHRTRTRGPRKTPQASSGRILKGPVFSQPQPTPDPSTFRIRHASDTDAYAQIDKLNAEHKLAAMPFDKPRGNAPEPVVTLTTALGNDPNLPAAIEKQQQIVFHATGDCGNVKGPKTQNEVADKMVGDFDETDPREVPQFLLLLGDVVYNFGESQYYYDQFYEPYRNYHAPIFAVAGNHDGMISPLAHAKSLEAYLRNFCADPAKGFVVTPEAGGLSRTAQIQPGVYFTLDAPMVRILVVYSNTLEDPGVIANSTIGNSQLKYLKAALQRAKTEKYPGAILLAHHHPPHTIGGQPQQLRIEYHPASDSINAKTPDDSVTVDLRSRKRVTYKANDLGLPAQRTEVQQEMLAQKSRPRWRS